MTNNVKIGQAASTAFEICDSEGMLSKEMLNSC